MLDTKNVKKLSDIDVFGKRVFVRADLDVGQALNAEGLTTNARLLNLKPTVDWLLEHGAKKVIIAGHIGRPKQLTENSSKPQLYDQKLSTKQLIEPLEKILGQKIQFSSQLTVDSLQSENAVNREPITDNRILLLENLRFWPGEEANDVEFAKELARITDVYVNDAFGVCHRAHASIVGVPAIFAHVEDPEHSRRAAGLHLQKEVEELSALLRDPQRPFVAIVGGAKIETKVPVIENLSKVADFVLVGGDVAKQFKIENLKFKIDENKIIAANLTEDTKDINQDSIEKFKSVIARAKTIVWDGPMGYFEGGNERGTVDVAQSIIESGAYSVVGGGETTQFLASKNLLSRFSFVSSGGGAMLEFLAGKELPGLKALE